MSPINIQTLWLKRRAEDVANLVHGIHAFIDEGDALLAAGFAVSLFVNVTGGGAAHELHDVVELIVAKHGAEQFAELFGLSRRQGEAEFLLDGGLGLAGNDILELGAKNFADGAVEFHGFGDAEAVDLDAGDVETGAREKVDDVAGATGGKAEVVGLDEDEGALGLFIRSVGDGAFDDAAIFIGVFGPELRLLAPKRRPCVY